MLRKLNNFSSKVLDNFQSIFLFLIRLTLAYGFVEPATNKWSNINNTADWFYNVGIPFPLFNVYLVASIESIGIVLLTLGLFTRFISFPLILVMIIAIATVHVGNGFSTANNGFEIPLYYLLFLGIFLSFGAGKISLDNLLIKKLIK